MTRRKTCTLLLSSALLLCAACAALSPQAVCPQPVIALLTDFGERDHYTGAMKGAIYSANPAARIDCISHEIGKFDIAEGAYTLAEAAAEYPAETIFVALVDPGVGSSRRAIAIKTSNGKIFLGPDNGILSLAAREAGVIEVRQISNRAFMRAGEISNTFHGRDVFGPAAGHLAAGAPFETIGPVLLEIVELALPESLLESAAVIGAVAHIDDYGNIITNIPVEAIEKLGISRGDKAKISIGDSGFTAPFVRTYSDVAEGQHLFLNNRGVVEIAINKRNLAGSVGAQAAGSVKIAPLDD